MAINDKSVDVCVACDKRPKICNGPCACSVDGRDVLHHLTIDGCPLDKFPKPDDKPTEVQPPVDEAILAALPKRPEPEKLTPAQMVIHGAKGIAKAIFGVGGADEALIKSRTDICNTCENAILSLGVLSRCKLCGCATWAKVRNANEHCPAGKW